MIPLRVWMRMTPEERAAYKGGIEIDDKQKHGMSDRERAREESGVSLWTYERDERNQ